MISPFRSSHIDLFLGLYQFPQLINISCSPWICLQDLAFPCYFSLTTTHTHSAPSHTDLIDVPSTGQIQSCPQCFCTCCFLCLKGFSQSLFFIFTPLLKYPVPPFLITLFNLQELDNRLVLIPSFYFPL